MTIPSPPELTHELPEIVDCIVSVTSASPPEPTIRFPTTTSDVPETSMPTDPGDTTTLPAIRTSAPPWTWIPVEPQSVTWFDATTQPWVSAPSASEMPSPPHCLTTLARTTTERSEETEMP